MAGSVFGRFFRVSTWGESHGPALGCVIDGCPAGLPLSIEDIQPYLDRRRPGTSAATTARSEADRVELLSGVFEEQTTGTPISLLIRNTSQRSGDYGNLSDTYRPGHADYGFDAKYGIRDYRGGGRSSGRETAARVAAGAVAIKALAALGIELHAYTASIGDVAVSLPADHILSEEELATSLSTPVGMPEAETAERAFSLIRECREKKDSIGGSIRCCATGLPAGLGEPVFDKLDARLAQAVFSIGAVKAVEIGDGCAASCTYGSENNDAMRSDHGDAVFLSNHAGGVLGGISTGAPLLLTAHFKPTPSIYQPQQTIKKDGSETVLTIAGRHDPVVVPRAVVVVECMCALVLLDTLLEHTGARMEYLERIYKR